MHQHLHHMHIQPSQPYKTLQLITLCTQVFLIWTLGDGIPECSFGITLQKYATAK